MAAKAADGKTGEDLDMMIDEYHAKKRAEELGEDKEIKVKIPLAYHIKLHTVKVVKGQNISETVKAALAHYFAEMAANPRAPEVEAAMVSVLGTEFATPEAPVALLRKP